MRQDLITLTDSFAASLSQLRKVTRKLQGENRSYKSELEQALNNIQGEMMSMVETAVQKKALADEKAEKLQAELAESKLRQEESKSREEQLAQRVRELEGKVSE